MLVDNRRFVGRDNRVSVFVTKLRCERSYVRLRVSVMIPAVIALGATSVYAARAWVQREVALRVDAERLHAPAAAPAKADERFGTIVVAARPLAAGVELTKASLREIPWPKDDTLQGAFSTVDQVIEGKGKRSVVSPLAANEPVLAKKITGPGQPPTLAAAIEPGYKAVTVRVDDVMGVGGFIIPGDHVDVLLSRRLKDSEAVSDIVAQDLKVLGTDQQAHDDAAKPKVARSVTLEVDTQDAQRLVVAQSIGVLTLVLRRVGAAAIEPSQRVTTTDLERRSQNAPTDSVSARTTVGVIRNANRQDYSVPVQRSH